MRGARAYCTACGAPRSLLEDTPVNVAGQPSKIGGGVASVAGWVILITGLLLAGTLGGLIGLLNVTVAWIVGGFLGGMSVLFGLLFILGGRLLWKTGKERERGAHEQAVLAVARRNAGSVTPAELARAVNITEAEADARLTEMAKRPDGRVTLEVDDDGTLRYYVKDMMGARIGAPRVRVGTGARVPPHSAEQEALAEAEMGEEEARARAERRR
ncbi:hypothetical protein KEG38_17590 [Polyangium jinanense]|uniref:Uncharacterized protein n=1 Tax=Polyangium jinanense TaxID=2829994 RepID=A0A9X4ATL5_9BACT|nr:hypothetical protein [Polyangium jinanense]MDC3955683.1 hypothetical protein [Polyangium jinanense]MDC3982325.1 hypothetical protein [Polyangium jinanense]